MSAPKLNRAAIDNVREYAEAHDDQFGVDLGDGRTLFVFVVDGNTPPKVLP